MKQTYTCNNESNPFDPPGERLGRIVLKDGRIIYPLRQAYLAGTIKNAHYKTLAYFHDDDFTESPTMTIIWDALNDDDDEGNRCNWEKPSRITHYKLGELI